MARKNYEGTGLLPGIEPEPKSQAGPRPRVRAGAPERPPLRPWMIVRLILLAGVLVASIYAFRLLEQFLIRDPRFALGGADGSTEVDSMGDSPIDIRGAAHVPRRAVEAVFASDLGRSVYLLPLDDRRSALRSVAWVKDASLARFWPNRLVVRVTERQPVAFVTLSPSRFSLIDEDGVILPPAMDHFSLPVLAGVHASDSIEDRRDRVKRMLEFTRALGADARKISEIDVSDRDDLKVSLQYDGRMVALLLGDRNFAARYRNFEDHYTEIKRRLPGAATLDLRLEDRITVVE